MIRILIAAAFVCTAAAIGGAPAAGADVYYKNCTAARNAGDTPLYVGDQGYAEHLDRDGDGVACE
jgi:hypothetical protein